MCWPRSSPPPPRATPAAAEAPPAPPPAARTETPPPGAAHGGAGPRTRRQAAQRGRGRARPDEPGVPPADLAATDPLSRHGAADRVGEAVRTVFAADLADEQIRAADTVAELAAAIEANRSTPAQPALRPGLAARPAAGPPASSGQSGIWL